MATPKQAAKRRPKKHGGGRSAKAGLIFPVGRVARCCAAAQYARRIGASGAVYMRCAGVPDSRAAGAVREGGEPAGKEAEAPDAPHGDACRAPRRRPRHAPEECDAARGGVIPSLNKGGGEEAQEQQEARATPSA
ncbi:hypothetical protein TcBrA4_0093910 [Trypanosoma cruzi]|nr:hypothetical protein TcBrA4_0093910 [Trypanosoma cruzi]